MAGFLARVNLNEEFSRVLVAYEDGAISGWVLLLSEPKSAFLVL